ncbi:MAG TPA: isochorismatase family protein [Thermomicrobiales bacterium]|nr:isochorismatase family protein [Thermomicrobiales bacterium]
MTMARHPLTLLTREVAPFALNPASVCLLLQDLHAPFADPDEGWMAARARQKVLSREFDEYFDTLRLIAPNIAALVRAFRSWSIPVMYSCLGRETGAEPSRFQRATGMDWRLDGPDGRFPPAWQPMSDEPVFSRPGWGALSSHSLLRYLRDAEIDSVVVIGTMFDFGIRQTCVELADHGFGSLIVSDAVCALTASGYAHTAGNIAHGLTKLRSTAELLDLMAGLAEHGSVVI